MHLEGWDGKKGKWKPVFCGVLSCIGDGVVSTTEEKYCVAEFLSLHDKCPNVTQSLGI